MLGRVRRQSGRSWQVGSVGSGEGDVPCSRIERPEGTAHRWCAVAGRRGRGRFAATVVITGLEKAPARPGEVAGSHATAGPGTADRLDQAAAPGTGDRLDQAAAPDGVPAHGRSPASSLATRHAAAPGSGRSSGGGPMSAPRAAPAMGAKQGSDDSTGLVGADRCDLEVPDEPGSAGTPAPSAGGAPAPPLVPEGTVPDAGAARVPGAGVPGVGVPGEAPTPSEPERPSAARAATADPAAALRVAMVRLAWCGGGDGEGLVTVSPRTGSRRGQVPEDAALAAARAVVALADGGDGAELRSLLRPDPGAPATSWTVACYRIGDLVPTAMRDFSDPVAAVRTLMDCGDPDHVAGELVASNAAGLHWTALIRAGAVARFQLVGASWSEGRARSSRRGRGDDRIRRQRGASSAAMAGSDLVGAGVDACAGDGEADAGEPRASRAPESTEVQRRWALRLAGWSADQVTGARWTAAITGLLPEGPTGARQWDLAGLWRKSALGTSDGCASAGAGEAAHERGSPGSPCVEELAGVVRDLVAEVRRLHQVTDALVERLDRVERADPEEHRPAERVDPLVNQPADRAVHEDQSSTAAPAAAAAPRRRGASRWSVVGRDRVRAGGDRASS